MLIKELEKNFQGSISRNLSLASKTAFKTGGTADYFIEPGDIASLKHFLKFMEEKDETFTILGSGTNTLVKDSGLKYVLSLLKGFNGLEVIKENKKEIFLRVGAGHSLSKLCWHCAKQNFRGVNKLIGIPGSLGGAVSMNAGTREGDILSIVQEVNIIDFSGKIHKLEKNDFISLYRHFKPKDPLIKKYIIINALIKLEKADDDRIYAEAKELLRKRKESQPLRTNNAGCFFKNPSSDMPAGLLIDKAGLKGKKHKTAAVSEKHANFITSSGSGSSADIIELKNFIQDEIKRKFDVELKPEVKIVGR